MIDEELSKAVEAMELCEELANNEKLINLTYAGFMTTIQSVMMRYAAKHHRDPIRMLMAMQEMIYDRHVVTEIKTAEDFLKEAEK